MTRAKGALVTPVPGTGPRPRDSSWKRTWNRWGQGGEVNWHLNNTTRAPCSIPSPSSPVSKTSAHSRVFHLPKPNDFAANTTPEPHTAMPWGLLTAQKEFPCFDALQSAQQCPTVTTPNSNSHTKAWQPCSGSFPQR